MSQEDYYAHPFPLDDEKDERVHNEHGFCDDMSHSCHEDAYNVAVLGQAVRDGKATPQEADLIYQGCTL